MQSTCVRLEHLRALSKARKLGPNALIDLATEQPRGVRSDKGRALVRMASLPHAANQPALLLTGTDAVIAYRDVASALIEIRFTAVAGARGVAEANHPEAFVVYRVEGDPWYTASLGATDPRDTDFELYLVAFEDVSYELIARKLQVSTKLGE